MTWNLHTGDALTVLRTLPAESVHCCVTSPPYWGLRDYGVAGQLGLEASPAEYLARMVEVFGEVRRVLRKDGTLWLNIGDSYNAAGRTGHGTRVGYKQETNRASAVGADSPRPSDDTLKPKDLCGVPWRLAFALQADGWWLRQDIIWHKPNPMPESVRDRCTKAHEYIFMLTKSARYYYDAAAVSEPAIYAGLPGQDASGFKDPEQFNGKHRRRADKQRGHGRMEKAEQCGGMRNKRSVWTVATSPFPGAHFATYPEALIEPCILAGSPKGGTVLDPFSGAGTTGLVAAKLGRAFVGIELNPEYVAMAELRCKGPLFVEQ